MGALTAFGGGPLVGDKLVRVVYVDETGHSRKQSIVIVAGLVLDPDRQWRVLAERIEALRVSDVPEQFREGFVFHATDLMYGGKYRHEWPDEDRWRTLEKLVAIPHELRMPLCVGYGRKPEPRDEDPHVESVIGHVIAYSLCMKGADWFMVNRTGPDDLAMVVAEQRKEVREKIEQAHHWLTDEKEIKNWLPQSLHKDFPITRVKAPPAFATKEMEPLLQIADACAFVFQRHANAASQSDRFVQALCGDFAHPAALSELRTQAGGCMCFYWPTEQELRDHLSGLYSATSSSGAG